MTGAADSLDAGLVSEPLERHEPRFEAEYAFDAGFRAWRAESEKIKRMFWCIGVLRSVKYVLQSATLNVKTGYSIV